MLYGGSANWYNGIAIMNWSNNYTTLTCEHAKGFQKSLTSNAGMTGNNSMPRANIVAVWGVK